MTRPSTSSLSRTASKSRRTRSAAFRPRSSPPLRTARERFSTFTAAATPSAPPLPTGISWAPSPRRRGPGPSPSTTAARPRIRFPPRWMTRSPGIAACSRPGRIRVRSFSAAIRRAAASPSRRCSPFGTRGSRSRRRGCAFPRGRTSPTRRSRTGPMRTGTPWCSRRTSTAGAPPILPGPIPARPSRRRSTPTSRASRPFSSRSAQRRCFSTIRAGLSSGARWPGSMRPSRCGTR